MNCYTSTVETMCRYLSGTFDTEAQYPNETSSNGMIPTMFDAH